MRGKGTAIHRFPAAAALCAVCILTSCGPGRIELSREVESRPRIFPDYTDTVIPPNIAPLNFVIDEPGNRYRVLLSAGRDASITIDSRSPAIVIPARAWRRMLQDHAGGTFTIDVAARQEDGQWIRYRPITNRIAAARIDGYLVYRLFPPVSRMWRLMGIYQRRVETFEEKAILDNARFTRERTGAGCVNCHTFRKNRTDAMSLQVRSKDYGLPMIVVRDGHATKVDVKASGFRTSPAAYHSWHPTHELIAFSCNRPSPFEHSIGEHRDVWDADSDIGVYALDSRKLTTHARLAAADRRETWPSWSADGRHLNFCSAPQIPFQEFRTVRYDMARIPFDPDTMTWGEPETLVAATNSNLSAAQPRESPDGRWLLFCLSAYGNFPIYRESSDLYLMDLLTKEYRRLAVSSPAADSWHCWSSNGRWIAFASRRIDGLLTRVHFSYFDETGKAHKAFVLPQKDPGFYRSCAMTYNVPELVSEPVAISERRLARAICAPSKAVVPKFDGGKVAGPPDPESPPEALPEWEPAPVR